MKRFKLTKTQKRMSRIVTLVYGLHDLVRSKGFDPLKVMAVMKRLDAAHKHLKSRHHKRANTELTMALALMKGL